MEHCANIRNVFSVHRLTLQISFFILQPAAVAFRVCVHGGVLVGQTFSIF